MKPGSVQPLDLRQTINRDMENFMDDTRKAVVERLTKVAEAAGDIDKATALFHETDVDGSGELDKEELQVHAGPDIRPEIHLCIPSYNANHHPHANLHLYISNSC